MKLSPQMESAISELKSMITAQYPDAQFEVARAIDEPEGFHLRTTVDIDDVDEVTDLVIDRELELNVEEGIYIHVIPLQPLERVLANMNLSVARA